MRLSFDDEESFKEAIESLRFNCSDPNTRQQMGSSNSILVEDSERNEDHDNIAPSDLIILRRLGSSSILTIQETQGSADIPVSFNSPPSNPEFIGTSSNGM